MNNASSMQPGGIQGHPILGGNTTSCELRPGCGTLDPVSRHVNSIQEP
jgi:hypothetical protein